MLFFLFIQSSMTFAEDNYAQLDKDAIREYWVENILNIKPSMVRLSTDVKMLRYQFETRREYDEDSQRKYPPIPPNPVLRYFSRQPMMLDTVFKFIHYVSGYEVLVHPDVDINMMITLNTDDALSINELSRHIEFLAKISIGVADESEMIIAMPSWDTYYPSTTTVIE
mgnify:FL=1